MNRHAEINSVGIVMPFAVDGDTNFIDTMLGHDFWGKYVIGQVAKSGEDGSSGAMVRQSNNLFYSVENSTIQCDESHIPSAIKFLAHLLERERQRNGIYTIHGNVITLGESAVACVGGISGIGKTSLSVAAYRQGWEWTSDEKFLMNEDGDYIQGLSSTLDDAKTKNATEGIVPLSPCTPRRLGSFVIPIVSEQPLTIHEYDVDKAIYHLYEEMGRNITASRGIFRDYASPLPSIDTPEIAERRYDCAVALAQRIPMYFMIGSTSSILKQLSRIT